MEHSQLPYAFMRPNIPLKEIYVVNKCLDTADKSSVWNASTFLLTLLRLLEGVRGGATEIRFSGLYSSVITLTGRSTFLS